MEKVKFSIEKEDPLEVCPHYRWRETLQEDDRYQTIGFINLDLMQSSNGVYDSLNTIVPLDRIDPEDTDFGLKARESISLNVMTRRRYKWDIKCELKARSSWYFFR